MLSPEEAIMRKQKKEEGEFSDPEDSLWRKVKANSENNKLDIDSFKDVYPRDEIEKDKQKVKGVEENFDRTIKKLSELLEQALAEKINNVDWFGGGSRATNTTDYDDYFNHTDILVEWPDKDSGSIKLALDTSITNKGDVISKKAGKIMDELEQRKGTTIKYFQSQFTEEKGKKDNIPSAVLALDRESMNNFCEFLDTAKQEDLEKSTLSTHMLALVYDQMIEQMKELEEGKATDSEIYKNLSKVADKIFDITEKEGPLRNKEPDNEVNLAELELRPN